MIVASEALADLDGKADGLYHQRCVPRGALLPPLTRSQVRAANKTYSQPVNWDAYLEVVIKGSENEGVERKNVVVKAANRADAFDKVRGIAVRYQRRYPSRAVVTEGVSHKPRLTR
jgi:hypothetical protein